MSQCSNFVSKNEVVVYDNYMGHSFAKYKLDARNSDHKHLCYPQINSVLLLLKSAFLPEGYPKTVSNDYFEYQIWDTVQALASSVIGMLAGQALLVGVGVGDANATLLAASLTWLFKDGAGMVGRILFAAWKGTTLDSQCKQWRLFADLLNDLAFFLEIFSLHVLSFFPIIVCVTSVMRALVGMVGGATRAAITQHQALVGNMADVAAKDSSQETLSNLLALVVNLLLITIVTGNSRLVWTLFSVLAPLHIYANWRAVRCLELRSLNRSRFRILTQAWLRQHNERSERLPPLPSVSEVNRLEPLVWPFTLLPCRTIHLGCSFAALTGALRTCKPLPLMGVYAKERYILFCPEWKESGYKGSHLTIYICLQADATTKDMLKAMFHAEVICGLSTSLVGIGDFGAYWEADDGIAFFAWSLGRVNFWFPRLIRGLEEAKAAAEREGEASWDLSMLQFDPAPWRIYRNVYYD